MARSSVVSALTLLLVVSSVCHVESLKSNYYRRRCPGAEQTIASIVANAVQKNPEIGAGMIRLFFHDCFVEGCDASILIDGPNAEKTAIPNLTLHSLELIDQVKAVLEKRCRKTVSCADIVAYTAATSLSVLGGPSVNVKGGRYDGLVSSASEALAQIPAPFSSLSTLKSQFSSKGLNVNDLVTLSGAHTVGKAHCSAFSGRLRNFSSTSQVDPSLDSGYAKFLQKQCPIAVSGSTVVSMDPPTPASFDNDYYKLVENNKGLFTSDAQLLTSSATRNIVAGYAGNTAGFRNGFGAALVKMGKIGLKTKKNGNIRTTCRSFT